MNVARPSTTTHIYSHLEQSESWCSGWRDTVAHRKSLKNQPLNPEVDPDNPALIIVCGLVFTLAMFFGVYLVIR